MHSETRNWFSRNCKKTKKFLEDIIKSINSSKHPQNWNSDMVHGTSLHSKTSLRISEEIWLFFPRIWERDLSTIFEAITSCFWRFAYRSSTNFSQIFHKLANESERMPPEQYLLKLIPLAPHKSTQGLIKVLATVQLEILYYPGTNLIRNRVLASQGALCKNL